MAAARMDWTEQFPCVLFGRLPGHTGLFEAGPSNAALCFAPDRRHRRTPSAGQHRKRLMRLQQKGARGRRFIPTGLKSDSKGLPKIELSSIERLKSARPVDRARTRSMRPDPSGRIGASRVTLPGNAGFFRSAWFLGSTGGLHNAPIRCRRPSQCVRQFRPQPLGELRRGDRVPVCFDRGR
jgi:hypothetical protein